MFTVLGSSGYIGTELVRHLRQRGHDCRTPGRDDVAGLLGPSAPDLGHVVYCIGLTADFRQRPFETVDAHVSLLARVAAGARFESLLYLSSTRVYDGAASGREQAALKVQPSDPSDLYNLTKLTGEALCLALDRPNVRVVRLSNVYGGATTAESFLSSIIRDAICNTQLKIHSDRRSAKDYVAIDNVVPLLERIALTGSSRLYNVAAGRAVANETIVERLSALTGCRVTYDPGAPMTRFPEIMVDRITEEFGFRPLRLEDRLSDLVALYREDLQSAG